MPGDDSETQIKLARIATNQEHLSAQVEKLDSRVQKIEGIAKWGEGVGWVIIRLGALASLVILLWEFVLRKKLGGG